jgi:hypothetical protein
MVLPAEPGKPTTTYWGGKSFEEMDVILRQENADRQRASARGWINLAQQFEALSANIAQYHRTLKPHWDSAGGDAFLNQLTLLVGTLNTSAHNFRVYADILSDTALAVDAAKKAWADVSRRRGQYMTNIDDWNNYGDADGLKNKVIDIVKDTKHKYFDADDPAKFEAARLAAFDNEARTIMKTLASAYVAADSGVRPAMPTFKGPLYFVQQFTIPRVPAAPAMPVMPHVPTAGPPPAMPTMPTPLAPNVPVMPVPVVPVVNKPNLPPPPSLPPPPKPPVMPVLPVLPGLPPHGMPGLGTKPMPSLPPSPGLNPGKSGLPAGGLPSKSGVIGKRPEAGRTGLPPAGKAGLPPAAGRTGGPGNPGKTGLPPGAGRGGAGKTALPPAAGRAGGPGNPGKTGLPPGAGRGGAGKTALPPAAGRSGVIGQRPAQLGQPPSAGGGRAGLPPGAGDRRGVIGRQPGQTGQPGGAGMPPGQRGRGLDPRQPGGARGVPERAVPRSAARGVGPTTIGNRGTAPLRPVDLDHDVIGGRPGATRGRGVPTPESAPGRRPGIAARNAAAPPVVRNASGESGQQQQQDQLRRQHRRTPFTIDDSEFAVTEQVAPPPVIDAPERTEHSAVERGPAIGRAG